MEKGERMAFGRKEEPPIKVTVPRLISPVWAVEVLEAYKAALVHRLFAVEVDFAEAALIYPTFAGSLLSISFISG